MFFEKVGIYDENLLDTIDEAEKHFYYAVIDKILLILI